MKLVKLFILAILPLATFSQNSDSIIKRNLTIGFVFSPDYCFRTLTSDNSDLSNVIITSRNKNETPKFGYTAGITGMLAFSSRISLQTGLLFSDKGYQAEVTDLVFNEPEPVTPVSFRSVDHYFYADIPIRVNYFLFTGKLNMFISAGLSADVLLKHKQRGIVKWDDGSITKSRSTVSFNHPGVTLSVNGGLGLDYSLTERLGIRIAPEYRRFILPISNTPVKGYLYSFGIETGIFYHL